MPTVVLAWPLRLTDCLNPLFPKETLGPDLLKLSFKPLPSEMDLRKLSPI